MSLLECRRGHLPESIRLLAAGALLLGATASAAALPVPVHCQADPRGANDRPGQRDATKFCVDEGDGAPFELHTIVNLDETTVTGANTIDACALFNADGDAFADLAVCVTMRSSGAANGNLTEYAGLRLFTCSDRKADRCTTPVLVPKPYTTACEVDHTDDDPFGPADPNGPGDDYPWDSRILCAVDLDDFGLHSPVARLADGCTFPSSAPNSAAEDCVLFQRCTNAAGCDDGNDCSVDRCDSSGVCVHTPAPPAACSDGLFCNGEESCNSLGYCAAAGAPQDCDDGIDCTIDSCDELADACVNDPRASACDDGLFCNGMETCDPAGGCTAGPAPACDDGLACTSDSCDEDLDTCGHDPVDALCDDGRYCTGEESCDAGAGCVQGPAPACDDAVACTIDACEEATRSCSHAPSDAACSDGRFCNGAEACDPAAGCGPGIAPSCDDGVECTLDQCDPVMNACVHDPDNFFCSDGDFCNGIEVCDPTAGCRSNRAPCSGSARCTDQCGGCSADADCDDAIACNGAESCDLASGACLPGLPPDCFDGIACTLDACEEAAGGCTHVAIDAACDDGAFCNGAETCDPAAGCRSGVVAACDDGIACTIDSCAEDSDSCTHAPDDGSCDNGLFCDGVETCDAGYGCQAGEDVRCRPDRLHCSIERCQEATDSCTSDFTPCVCGDREVTGLEECEPPRPAGTFEDCNNLVDDDRDTLVDCSDPDCSPENRDGWICDENCRHDLACAPVRNDPALIVFRQGDGPDSLWIHGRFEVRGDVDPSTEVFTIRLSNAAQPIFVAALEAGALKARGAYYEFVDDDARHLGEASAHGGLAAVRVRKRTVGGVPNLAFRVQAWGDFRAATRREMTSEIAVGPQSGTLTAEWKAKPKKWLLRQKDF